MHIYIHDITKHRQDFQHLVKHVLFVHICPTYVMATRTTMFCCLPLDFGLWVWPRMSFSDAWHDLFLAPVLAQLCLRQVIIFRFLCFLLASGSLALKLMSFCLGCLAKVAPWIIRWCHVRVSSHDISVPGQMPPRVSESESESYDR